MGFALSVGGFVEWEEDGFVVGGEDDGVETGVDGSDVFGGEFGEGVVVGEGLDVGLGGEEVGDVADCVV